MEAATEEIDQYRIALRALTAFGNLPGSFSLAIYLLMQHPKSGPMDKSGAAAFQANRLLSVSKVSTATRSAAGLYGVQWDENETIPEFDPLSMAGIFFSIYLHHRVNKMCDQTEWDFITPQYLRDIVASGIVLKSLYKSGLGVALIGTTAIYSALGSICALDKKVFREYRRRRKSQGFLINKEVELELFGCSTITIGQEIIQRFRFGTKIVESFSYGFDMSIPEAVLPPRARPFRSLVKLLSAIHLQDKSGASLDYAALGINVDARATLSEILNMEQASNWLSSGSPSEKVR